MTKTAKIMKKISENTMLKFLLPEHALPSLLTHFQCVCTCVSLCGNIIQELPRRIPSFSSVESFSAFGNLTVFGKPFISVQSKWTMLPLKMSPRKCKACTNVTP